MKHSILKIFIAIMLMDLLCGMEFDLFVPSFPQLQHYFSLSTFWVEALLSVNFIGYFLSLFFVGKLSDRYGRKQIIIAGLLVFVFGSVLCLCEQAFSFLLIGRFLQGVGIAAPAILSFLIVADNYPIKEQQFLMAMLNGVMNTACAIAPVVGSYIALYFHWQGNFATLLILGLLTLSVVLLFIPMYQTPQHPAETVSHQYWLIFKSKPLMLVVFMLLINFLPYWIFVGMSPLLYIKALGVSLHYFGLYQGSLALAFAIGSVVYGLFIKYKPHNQKAMLHVGNGVFFLSFLMMTALIVVDTQNPFLITLAMLIFVIGQIIPGAILTPLALNFMPHAKARVSAVLQGGRLMLTSIALQGASLFYADSFLSVGWIIAGYILLTVVLLFFVIKNETLMKSVS